MYTCFEAPERNMDLTRSNGSIVADGVVYGIELDRDRDVLSWKTLQCPQSANRYLTPHCMLMLQVRLISSSS